MQTIFYLKVANAVSTANNSIVLRFKVSESGKYKVKGLAISCSKKDWDQEEQRVRRSNEQHKKYNAQLVFIKKELEKIETERNVVPEDIDEIVEASKKGITIKELKNNSQNLTTMIKKFYDEIKDSENYSYNYKRKFKTMERLVAAFEKKVGYRITATLLNKKIAGVQRDLVKYFRVGRKDSSIRNHLTVINAAINFYNRENNDNIKTFTKKEIVWGTSDKDIVFLNSSELKKLYDLVYNPHLFPEIKPAKMEIRNMKYFLFRCFCGMRVGDMNSKNIHRESLKKDSKTFTYFQVKGRKSATVPCIRTYLYDIADSLGWEFPNYKKQSTLTSYISREIAVVRKYLSIILKDNMRKIKHTTIDGIHTSDLSLEVSTHTSRKTFAYLVYGISNNDLLLVMKSLGHTKLETTMKYLGIDLSEEKNDFTNINLNF